MEKMAMLGLALFVVNLGALLPPSLACPECVPKHSPSKHHHKPSNHKPLPHHKPSNHKPLPHHKPPVVPKGTPCSPPPQPLPKPPHNPVINHKPPPPTHVLPQPPYYPRPTTPTHSTPPTGVLPKPPTYVPTPKPPVAPALPPPYTIPTPHIPYVPALPPPTQCPPPPKPAQCPVDALKLGACVDLLGGLVHIGIGGDVKHKCCPLLQGLLDLDAAVCLCTTIKAKLLNINLIVPIALQVLVTCDKAPPPGFNCA